MNERALWIPTAAVLAIAVSAACSSSPSARAASGASEPPAESGADGGASRPISMVISRAGSRFEIEPAITGDGQGHLLAVWTSIFPLADGGTGDAGAEEGGTYAGFADDGPYVNTFAVSKDDGTTWSTPKPIDSTHTGFLEGDPAVAVDSQDNFYAAWLAYVNSQSDPSQNQSHIFAAKLNADYTAFGPPVPLSDDGTRLHLAVDKPWISVDGSDRIVVTWSDRNLGQMVATSNSHGERWSKAVMSPYVNGDDTFSCSDCARPGSAEYVTFLDFAWNQGFSVPILKSVDQKGWRPLSPVAALGAAAQVPNCAIRSSDVWLSYATSAAPVETAVQQGLVTQSADSVRVLHSTNGGARFAAAVVTSGSAKAQYMLPQLLVTPQGDVWVAYYQGLDGRAAQVVLARSTNGGATWTSTKLADAGTFQRRRDTPTRVGDYFGLLAGAEGDRGYAVFGDNSTGVTHIRFVRFSVPAP